LLRPRPRRNVVFFIELVRDEISWAANQIVFGDDTAAFTLVTREKKTTHAAPSLRDKKAQTETEEVKAASKKPAAIITGNPLGRKQLGKASMAWLAAGAAEVRRLGASATHSIPWLHLT
jgi:hypothetical protein